MHQACKGSNPNTVPFCSVQFYFILFRAHIEFSGGKSDNGAGFCMNTWVFPCQSRLYIFQASCPDCCVMDRSTIIIPFLNVAYLLGGT